MYNLQEVGTSQQYVFLEIREHIQAQKSWTSYLTEEKSKELGLSSIYCHQEVDALVVLKNILMETNIIVCQ